MKYINIFNTSGDVQTALNNQDLLKPYLAYISGSNTYDYNTLVNYAEEYFTFKITSAGVINWNSSNSASDQHKFIYYSKNGGSWYALESKPYSESTIDVVEGDIVRFKANNPTYCDEIWNTSFNDFEGTTCGFELEGNIMSLIYGDNFVGNNTLVSANTFAMFFTGCTGLTTAENLVLPATTLLTWCYYQMFGGCNNLNYVKCLATDISAENCTAWWMYDVSSTGTFVKKSGVNWPNGMDGIPTGWTIEEE